MGALEPVAPGLRHVALLQGTKAYGVHVRPLTVPACGIRGKAATDSDGRRPPIPIESGHPIRTNAATLLIG
ncbi:hypothetical protein ACVWXM_004615 [Bradyrhizobium sp. GM7.3]